MIYTTQTIERVLRSEAARAALDYISPIYGSAENFLHVLDAAGLELDAIVNWADGLWRELVPETAFWSIGYWEAEYGLKSDEAMPIEQRRALVKSKISTRRQINPARLALLVSSIAGVAARVEENTGKNRFDVYLTAATAANEGAIRAAIDRSKPAHLIYRLLYELYALGRLYVGGIVTTHCEFTMRQVGE